MPNSQYYNALRRALSQERLSKYSKPTDRTEAEAIARYFYNICLCESMYHSLQGLEIALRNSLDSVITDKYGKNWLSVTSFCLERQKKKEVADAIKRLSEQGKKNPTHADIVAAMSFGFWVGLLSRNYEKGLSRRGFEKGAPFWPTLLKPVFPYLETKNRTRKYVSEVLTKVRRLRNRVFHHEPIWYFNDLSDQHRSILTSIGWFCPELEQTVRIFDRFSETLSAGEEYCKSRLISLLRPEPELFLTSRSSPETAQ